MSSLSLGDYLARSEMFTSDFVRELAGDCERKVVQWRWSNALMDPVNPNDEQAIKEAKPKWVKRPPAKYAYRHGVDGSERIYIVSLFVKSTDDVPSTYWYRQYEGESFWQVRVDGEEIEIHYFECDENRWFRAFRPGARQTHIEEVLFWSEQRLDRFERRWWDAQNPQAKEPQSVMAHIYEYNHRGRLAKVVERLEWPASPDSPVHEEVIYPRKLFGNLNSLFDRS